MLPVHGSWPRWKAPAIALDAERLPTLRADGDREALRILLGTRREMTSDKIRMVNRLRALRLTGQEADRVLARGSMSAPTLTTVIRRRGRLDESRWRSVHRAEARRLALGIRAADQALVENKNQLAVPALAVSSSANGYSAPRSA